ARPVAPGHCLFSSAGRAAMPGWQAPRPGSMLYRTPFILLLSLVLAGCSAQVPQFLGRGGDGSGSFTMRDDPQPDAVPVPMRMARVEPGLRGRIVRVEIVAPTQGFHSADLSALNGGQPDENGVMSYMLVARPPVAAQAIGPER